MAAGRISVHLSETSFSPGKGAWQDEPWCPRGWLGTAQPGMRRWGSLCSSAVQARMVKGPAWPLVQPPCSPCAALFRGHHPSLCAFGAQETLAAPCSNLAHPSPAVLLWQPCPKEETRTGAWGRCSTVQPACRAFKAVPSTHQGADSCSANSWWQQHSAAGGITAVLCSRWGCSGPARSRLSERFSFQSCWQQLQPR